MPPIRDHDVQFNDQLDDKDGMPPLVDNPAMTYTFFADMTPFSFSTISSTPPPLSTSTSTMSALLPPQQPDFALSSPTSYESESPITHDEPQPSSSAWTPRSGSHGKKRDASYIPRPPNAFILFRSSFIRSQQVPGKVEGNHSTLSKIIGMYWKTLPKEEREQWEQKAIIAQAEHRKRYPDWRFRPGANAMAKLKIKDGGGGGSRRRNPGGGSSKPSASGNISLDFLPAGKGKGKEPAQEDASNDKGKGKGKEVDSANSADVKGKGKERARDSKKRVEKIVSSLVEGKKGVELELAIEEWEDSRRAKRKAKKATRELDPEDAVIISSQPTSTPQASSSSGEQRKSEEGSETECGSGGTADAEGEDYVSGDEDEFTSVPIPPFFSNSPNPLPSSPAPISSSMSPTFTFAHPPPLALSLSGSKASTRPSGSRERLDPASPASASEFRTVPLTSMYKRSLSAPAPHRRPPYQPVRSRSDHPAVAAGSDEQSKSKHIASSPAHPTHVRRDTVSLPVSFADYVQQPSPQQPSDPNSERAPSPPLAQPSQSLGVVAHPISVHWQDEEDRRRYEMDHGYWFPASTTHTIAERSEEGGSGMWESPMYDAQDTSTEDLGYPIPEEHTEYLTHPYVVPTSADGSEFVAWGTNPNRAGYVASIRDPYLPFTPVDSESSPTSPTSPPISSFSTLIGWAGDPSSPVTPSSSSSQLHSFSPLPIAESGKPPPGNPVWATSSWNTQLQPTSIGGSGDVRSTEDIRTGTRTSANAVPGTSGSGSNVGRGRGPRRTLHSPMYNSSSRP